MKCRACGLDHSPMMRCEMAARLATTVVHGVVHACHSEQEADQSAGPTALYRHFNRDGGLLYVGISLSPTYRLASHAHDAHWAQKIASVTIQWFDTRAAALAAESSAILHENPAHNIAGRARDVKMRRSKDGALVASRHGRYADPEKRKAYRREWMKAKRAAARV